MNNETGIEERVIARILARREAGRAKYGKTMERTDLNILQWMRHAQDEATDLAIYLERILSDITSVSEWSGPDIAGGVSSPNPVSVQERSESDCEQCDGKGWYVWGPHGEQTQCGACYGTGKLPVSSAATEEEQK